MLVSATSAFQSVVVLQSDLCGKVLVLDGVIQMTEKEAFAYHEMLVHLPLCSVDRVSENASSSTSLSVLLLGGGDGGALKQVVTQYDESAVQEIVVVEKDPMVIQVAKDYFDATPYFDNDKRVTVIRLDAATYLALAAGGSHRVVVVEQILSVAVVKSSVFEFCTNLHAVLAPSGVACIRVQGSWMDLELVSIWMACCRTIFDTVEYATTTISTCGRQQQVGFLLARRRNEDDTAISGSCRIPVRQPDHMDKLEWYSRDMHQAAFVLPPVVIKRLQAYDNEFEIMQGFPCENETSHFVGHDDAVNAVQSYPTGNTNGHEQATSRDAAMGDDDNDNNNEEAAKKCFLLDSLVLPQYVTSALASFHNASSLDINDEEGKEDSDEEAEKCFLFEPSQCTIQ